MDDGLTSQTPAVETLIDAVPLPRDPRVLLLSGILLVLAFYTLYLASEIVLPIILAFVLYLLLSPAMRGLAKLHAPKAVAALLMISLLIGGVAALGFSLSGPVAAWVAKVPETLPRLETRLSFLMKPLARLQRTTEQVEGFADNSASAAKSVTVKQSGLGSLLVSRTRAILTGTLTIVVLLFFLLISGDLFLRRLVEVLPTLTDKKRAVDISHEIEGHVSSYLIIISGMNAAVGMATGFAVYFCGLSDPVLWGTLAFLLNYILILGPLVCASILLVAGLLTFDSTLRAVLPAGVYLAIHFAEGQNVTPILLARRLTLNPVLIIVSLVFWYWMWGVLGALLAVPLLGTIKIICDRIPTLMPLGYVLGTEART